MSIQDYRDIAGELLAWRASTITEHDALLEDAATLINLQRTQLAEKEKELENQRKWVADLQCGIFVNCVYCGHRFGPGETTPVSMADALKAHVEQCPKHPMSALKSQLEVIRKERVEQIGNTIAELYTAAKKDYDSASNDEVGLNGILIKQWRAAYLEGCKDMAGNVASTFNDDEKEELKNKILTSLSPHYSIGREQ